MSEGKSAPGEGGESTSEADLSELIDGRYNSLMISDSIFNETNHIVLSDLANCLLGNESSDGEDNGLRAVQNENTFLFEGGQNHLSTQAFIEGDAESFLKLDPGGILGTPDVEHVTLQDNVLGSLELKNTFVLDDQSASILLSNALAVEGSAFNEITVGSAEVNAIIHDFSSVDEAVCGGAGKDSLKVAASSALTKGELVMGAEWTVGSTESIAASLGQAVSMTSLQWDDGELVGSEALRFAGDNHAPSSAFDLDSLVVESITDKAFETFAANCAHVSERPFIDNGVLSGSSGLFQTGSASDPTLTPEKVKEIAKKEIQNFTGGQWQQLADQMQDVMQRMSEMENKIGAIDDESRAQISRVHKKVHKLHREIERKYGRDNAMAIVFGIMGMVCSPLAAAGQALYNAGELFADGK